MPQLMRFMVNRVTSQPTCSFELVNKWILKWLISCCRFVICCSLYSSGRIPLLRIIMQFPQRIRPEFEWVIVAYQSFKKRFHPAIDGLSRKSLFTATSYLAVQFLDMNYNIFIIVLLLDTNWYYLLLIRNKILCPKFQKKILLNSTNRRVNSKFNYSLKINHIFEAI